MKPIFSPAPAMSELTEMQSIHSADAPSHYETEVGKPGEKDPSFRSMTGQQKRFHIFFYTLAVLTGLVIVQFIWQIAVLTAQ